MSKAHQEFICPVCTSKVRMRARGNLGWFQHFALVLAVAVFVGLIYLGFGPMAAPKAVFLYPFLWVAWEAVRWSEVKKQGMCRACGFDIQVYLRNWRSARTTVEANLNKKKDEIIAKARARHLSKTGSRDTLNS